MGTEGNVAQTACFRTTHLRNVPYTYMGKPSTAAVWSGFPASSMEDRHSSLGESCKKQNRKGACILGMMEDAQLTHVLMSNCTLKVLATIRDLCCRSGAKPLEVKVEDKGHRQEY